MIPRKGLILLAFCRISPDNDRHVHVSYYTTRVRLRTNISPCSHPNPFVNLPEI